MIEHGNRPAFLTKARTNTPQAVSLIADLLAAADWADDAGIVIDWRGDWGWPEDYGPMPPDLMQPLVYIGVRKRYRGDQLKVEVRLNVESTFTTEDIDNADLAYIVQSLKETVEERVHAREEGRVPQDEHNN